MPSNAIRVQVGVRVKLPKGGQIGMTTHVIDTAIREWADTGRDPRGFKILYISWEHGGSIQTARTAKELAAVRNGPLVRLLHRLQFRAVRIG